MTMYITSLQFFPPGPAVTGEWTVETTGRDILAADQTPGHAPGRGNTGDGVMLDRTRGC
ncbi:hypothetical protein [Streptomyces alboflavus]|uniref:hypothetical protein n=1 Tax=Streptomyces alboflavus TaxID=67267 RepID=UPI00368096F4